MPLCPLCFRSSIQRDVYWCISCGNKLNKKNDRKERLARIATIGISPRSIAIVLKIIDKMNAPPPTLLLTAPPKVMALTWPTPNNLLGEIKGQLSPNTKMKPVLADISTPLDQREAAWKVGEDVRVANLRKEVDAVEQQLKDQIQKHGQYVTDASNLSLQKASLGDTPEWLTLPELDKIDRQIDDELKKSSRKSEQDFDKIFLLQQSAVDYLTGVQGCLPDCQQITTLLNGDPDTNNDFQQRFKKLQTFINTSPATMNARKLHQIDLLKRQIMQSTGMRLLWKDALDKVNERLTYMISEDGFGIKSDTHQVLAWKTEHARLTLLAQRNPLTIAPLNLGIKALSTSIEVEAKGREHGRNNAILNSAGDLEKRSIRRVNGVGNPVYYSSLSADKQNLAKSIKHSKPLPTNWEKRPHHNHPGGNGSEFRLWNGTVNGVGSQVGGMRMTAVGKTVFNCSAHSANSSYDYLPVVGIPAWDPKPPLPADFPVAPTTVALLPV